MSRLEEKLIELGYRKRLYILVYEKIVYGNKIVIMLDTNNRKKIDDESGIITENNFGLVRSQQDIDNLQQAFNELQKDLEELRKYEKEN